MIKRVYLFVFFLVLSTGVSYAQPRWGGGSDEETLHFGFNFQYIAAEYKVLKKSNWKDPYFDADAGQFLTDRRTAISSPVSPGFGLGFVSDYKVNNNVNVRFTPSLVFSDRLLDYEYATAADNRQIKVQATSVELPVGLKLKSDRLGNYRAYLIGGAKYTMDIISKKKLNDEGNAPLDKLVKNSRNILWYEAGIGFDIYFEFFKLSPEIKLSNSYRNVLVAEDHPYSAPLDKLFLRNFVFSLYFE